MSNWNRRWVVGLGWGLILVVVAGIAIRNLGPGSVVTGDQSGGNGSSGGAEVAGVRSSGATPTSRSAAKLLLPSDPAIQWEELTFSAEGFQPGETVSLLADQGGTMKEIGQATVDSEGKIKDAKIQLPGWLESGNRAARAVGATSKLEATGTLHIRAKNLWVNLSSYSVRQAGKLGLIAGGFQPGDKIRVYLTPSGDDTGLASQQPLATMATDESGNSSWTESDVPVVQPGQYTLLLKGDDAKDELKAAVTVDALKPELELSPWSGLPGRGVTLNAKGFLPGEDVDVLVGASGQPVATVKADEFGNLWGAGPISTPATSEGGPLAITLRGTSSGAQVTSDFTIVSPHPWAELSSYAGFAGAPVMVHGGGFAAGEKVTLHLGSSSSPSLGEDTASEDGYYQGLGPAQVPSNATQDVTFVVVGESSSTQATATFKVMQPFIPELPPPPARQRTP